MIKCSTPNCNYRSHSKTDIGLYCCNACKINKYHGPLCERTYYNQIKKEKPKIFRHEVIIDKWMGRLGNNIMQIINAIHMAIYYNCDLILPDHPLFLKRIKIHNPTVNINKWHDTIIKDVTNSSFRQPYTVYPNIFTINKELAIKFLKESFKIKSNSILPLGDEDVVIHMRAGDVFTVKGHPDYYQPPLSFYVNLLNEKQFKNIYLSCEDYKNPCLEKILKLFPTIQYKQRSLEDDIKLILSAKHVVSSNGSFVDQIIKLSCHIQHIYKYENVDYARLMYPWDISPIKIQIMLKFDEKKPNYGI